MNFQNRISLLFVLLFILGSLSFSDLFIHKNLTPYFAFLLTGSLVCLFSGIVGLYAPVKKNLMPIFFVLVWASYIVTHSCLVSSGLNYKHMYLLSAIAAFCGFYLILQPIPYFLNWLFVGIILISGLESIYCLGQYFGILKSLNDFYPVTGSYENPNVTAIFLMMAYPALWFKIPSEKNNKTINSFRLIIACIVVFVLIILKCRSAYIGVVIITVFISFWRFNLFTYIKSFTKYKLFAITILGGLIFFVSSVWLYKSKQASADGRLLIWKISLQMIGEKPLSGFGYGSFEHEYNLHQAAYFGSGNGSTVELKNADFVYMAYSEPLENTIEGGIIGGLFFIALFLLLILGGLKVLRKYPKPIEDSKQIFYPLVISVSSITAFFFISIFNFSIQGIPIFVLAIIYSAIICNYIYSPCLVAYGGNKFYKETCYIFCIGSCIMLIFLGGIVNAHLKNKKGEVLLLEKKASEAITVLKPLSNNLASFESYRNNYARALMSNQQWTDAIVQLNEAFKYSSSLQTITDLGYCYYQLGDYKRAEQVFKLTSNIVPSYLYPRVALMSIYIKTNDTVNVVKMADAIVCAPVKFNDSKAILYKEQAQKALTAYSLKH